MAVPRGEALQVRHEIHRLLQGEEIRVARHGREAVLARVAGFRDDHRVRIQDGLGQVFGRVLGADPREVGSGLPLRRAPGKFLPLDLVATVTLELEEHRTARLRIPIGDGEPPPRRGPPVT